MKIRSLLCCCFPCRLTDDFMAKRLSARVDKNISSDNQYRQREIKILLLGTGESGKSTVVKQMKIIHQNGYTKAELLSFKQDIFRNLIESMQQMITAMQRLSIQFQTNQAVKASELLMSQDPIENRNIDRIDDNVADALYFLWNESGLKGLYDRLTQISYVLCSAPYFLDNLRRISMPDYVPSVQDIIRARIKTTGISEYRFKMGHPTICLIDVGGQIGERKKWINCFENVTSIIFCVALSEYDQVLLEDPSQSRMLDSFRLFQSIISSQWFHHTSIILFLNKTDIFKKKIQTSPLNKFFEDYQGGDNFDLAADFITKKFLALNVAKLPIYPHLTCATDTQQIETVFSAVKETILSKALNDIGIL